MPGTLGDLGRRDTRVEPERDRRVPEVVRPDCQYGRFAADAPVMHLRKVTGGDLVSTYLDSFEAVWNRATPVES